MAGTRIDKWAEPPPEQPHRAEGAEAPNPPRTALAPLLADLDFVRLMRERGELWRVMIR